MLQDLEYGRLENEYRPLPPLDSDYVLCFRGQEVLLRRSPDNTLSLPTVALVKVWQRHWTSWDTGKLRFLFRLHGVGYYLFPGESGDAPAPYGYERARALRQTVSREVCYAILTGWHLFCWYRGNRFCGCCGRKTVHSETERALRCESCGNLIFPRINPVVIVAVTDGDRLLLSRYAGRSYTHYALLAGYTEIGETMEQAAAREVMEEVGVKIKNLRYYKSQPWGVDGNILMGFFCDLDGDSTIHLDRTELSHAGWYDRRSLPIGDDGFSLTREMIRIFGEGKEPK